MSKLLINEPPLQVLPSLAAAIGLPEAIVLQQVHYWLGASRNTKDGRKWVYNTYEQWAEQFPFWKPESIRKIFKSLRDSGLILTMQEAPNAWNKTNFYTIDYEVLSAITRPEDSTGRPEDSTASSRKIPPHQPEDSTASLTETSPEKSTEKKKKKKEAAPKISFDGLKFENLSNEQVEAWKQAYPAVNVAGEILKAAVWLDANPANKKSDYKRFLNGWLSRSQDKAPPQGYSQGYGTAPAYKATPAAQRYTSSAQATADRRAATIAGLTGRDKPQQQGQDHDRTIDAQSRFV